MEGMNAGGGSQGVVPPVIPQTGPYLHLPQDPGGSGGGDGGGGVYGPGPVSMGSLADKLRVAASKGHVDKMQDLLQAGAGLEADKDGRTALHYAAQNGHADCCKLLIEKGCELDVQDSMGYSALLRACSQGLLDVVRICLEAGCNVEFADEHGNTALHEASWHGFSKCVELLIQYNANVFRTNQSGFSALHLTSQNGHNESSRVLLYGGITADMQNNYGDTALHTAARYGHAGVTRILISAKCKLNIQNKNGDTALHIAAALKRRKIAKILVESHSDFHVRNKQNETAIDVARRKEHPEIILIITSLSRPHSTGPRTREAPGVTFKDEIEVDDGPVVCADDEPPIKSDNKQEKERGFLSFFKKKKKDKDKEKDKDRVSQSTSTQVKRPVPPGKVQPVPSKPVAGFFSQYVPRTGTQYYRDLAGNIKQGPVGYTPVCQCGPALHHIEKTMQTTRDQLYDHIDASHQVLQDRIQQLDLRTSQQAHSLDHLTRERLEAERRACQAALEQRLQRERHRTQHVVESYGEGLQGQIQGWLEDRLASYGHCLDHHHDDSALPPRHIFTDVHLMGGPDGVGGVGGRLFRSRSDETLSVSDYSGKGRKKHFYESRKAAMEQIRGWKVPVSNKDSNRRRDSKGRNAANDGSKDPKLREDSNNNNNNNSGSRHCGSAGNIVTVAEVHSKPHDRTADGASPKYEGEGLAGVVSRQQDSYGAAGRQTPLYGAGSRRASQPHPHPHPHPHTHSHSHSHSHSHPAGAQAPHLVSQSRSHGNLSSPRPTSNTPTGASSISPATGPGQSSQYGAQPLPQPRRGILRSKTDESGLHERSRSSPRQQQQSNLDERGPQGESSFGLNPGGREGPFLGQQQQQQQPATTGPTGSLATAGHPHYHQYHQHNPLYGSAQFPSSPYTQVADSAPKNSSAVNVDSDSQRYRPRTRSIDGVLDGVDGYSGGRFRSRSEERILDSGELAVPTSHYPAGSSRAADCSGYVTDSGMRRSYLDHHSNQHYNPVRPDRTSGYWPQSRPECEDKSGSGGRFDRNNATRSASDDRSGGRYLSGDVRNDAVRSISNDRGPDSSKVYASNHRPSSSERNSSHFLESDPKRGGGGGGSQNVNWHSPSPAPGSSSQYRQQHPQQLPYQPATRYRVLPPLPPPKPSGSRAYPQVAPKPAATQGGQSAHSRGQVNVPTAKDAQQSSNPGRYTPAAPAASGQPQDNHPGRRNDPGVPFMSFQSYNYTGGGGNVLQERSMARRTDSPRELWESSRQLAKDKASLHRSSAALITPHNNSNSNPLSGGGRTPSPYSAVGGGNRNSVSKSEGNLNKVSDQGALSSPRGGGGESVSSGHYSVSNGCLRHESYSYPSPVYSGVGGGKEDSTCSSNQDSGYSSRMVGAGGLHGKTQGEGAGRRRGAEDDEDGGRGGAESATPSSSFSTDRSLSAGLPSNTSSPYLHLVGGNSYSDYVPMGGGHSYGEYVSMTLGGGREGINTSTTPTADFHQPGQRGSNPYRNYPQDSSSSSSHNAPTAPQLPDYPKTPSVRKGAWERSQPTSSVPDSTYPPFQQSRAGTAAPTPTPLPANGSWGNGGINSSSSSSSLIQKQVQGWYQQKLLEAAQRLRNSEQYGHAATPDLSNSNSFGKGYPSTAAVPIRYDPVHGSDV